MSELPYQAEYAKTGRAGCKGCKQKIDQGVLRLAVMVQSAFHDGKQPNWFHEDCFFLKQRPKSVDDFENFNKLKNPDQKKIKEKIENCSSIVLPVEKGKGKGKAAKRANPDNLALKDFNVEYSKSSRATCRHCDIKICKGEVRISKTVFDTEVGQKYGGQPLWHHVKCFNEERGNLGYLAGGEDLPGFSSLSKDDKQVVKDTIKPMKMDGEGPVKKIKKEEKDSKEIEEEKKLEKQLEKQNKLFHKYRDALKEYKRDDIKELLQANSQEVLSSVDERLSHLADCMAFGALEPCPECKQGQLVLHNFGYKCTGHLSAWATCTYQTRSPQRRPLRVPSSYVSTSAFLKYKPKAGTRLFPPAPVAAQPSHVVIKKEDPSNASKPVPPLKNLQFYIYGKLKSNKEDVKHRILKLGGLVVSSLTDTLAAVVSSKATVENMPSKMEDVKDKDIEVVEESFLDLINPDTGSIAKTLELIKENNIASWGSDPAKRVPQDVMDGKSIAKSGSIYVKSKSAPTTLKLKGGTAVDPESGLADVAHVYRDHDGTKYTVVLGRTDVVANKNSYYKIQVLEADAKKKYWLFTAWGRIGTTIGSTKLEDHKSKEKAICRFMEIYEEKTQNPWEYRSSFEKFPGAYHPIDVDYGEEAQETKLTVDSSCKLPEPVQRFVARIFDVSLMKKTLLEFELDTEKMPLGKLSKKQIKSGYKVLSELIQLIEKGQASQSKFIEATNRFYTLVPHSFGCENPPLLNNTELIKNKCEMLDSLLEIEIAYSLLKTDSDEAVSPIEAHYMKLKAEIVPLERESTEFARIQTYVTNTHAATHSNYTLEINQVFKVVREGEQRRYRPFRKLHNRRLLWHGSRVTNFAGILSQGLRIAPPEAPVTGYMFGKGIYFADMVSKSANYCCTNRQDPVGVMLLCEVALGDMKEYHKAEYVTKLDPEHQSVKGVGRTQPDPAQDELLDDGTVVPLGKPQTRDIRTDLLYNEFIVYDVAQVNVKYLLEMKFNYK